MLRCERWKRPRQNIHIPPAGSAHTGVGNKYQDNFETLGSIARIIQLEFKSLGLSTARLRCCSSHLHLKVCPVLTCALTPAHLVKQNAQVVKT